MKLGAGKVYVDELIHSIDQRRLFGGHSIPVHACKCKEICAFKRKWRGTYEIRH